MLLPHKPKRPPPPPRIPQIPRTSMNRHRVKHEDITRLHLPRQELVLLADLGVAQVGKLQACVSAAEIVARVVEGFGDVFGPAV